MLCAHAARAEPPAIPRADGAPGENQEPEFAVEPVGPGEQVFLQAPPGLPADVAAPVVDEARSNLDNLDKRAPVRKARQSAWDKATTAADAAQWDDVLRFLEQWHERAKDDGKEDSLVRQRDGSLGSGRLESARLLLRLPKEQRQQREEQFGGRARSQLDAAVQSGDLNRLSHVASRYFGTSGGYAAASRLATRLLDQGDFALAARWLLLLQEASAPGTDDPAWQKRTRLVRSIMGLKGGSANAPDDTPALDALANSLITAQPELVDEWRLSGGNAARHARTQGGEPVLIPRWAVSTVSSSRLQDSIDEMIANQAQGAVRGLQAEIAELHQTSSRYREELREELLPEATQEVTRAEGNVSARLGEHSACPSRRL